MAKPRKIARPGKRRVALRAAAGDTARHIVSAAWPLQDAKARFSELVRKAKSDGPQCVTVHGREEVVVVSATDYRRMSADVSGQVLVDAMQSSPHRDIDLAPSRHRAPVRDVDL